MKTTPSLRTPAFTGIESLEQRIAPAVLLNANTVMFSDHDGDDVTVHISKPLFIAGNVDTVLHFVNDPLRADGSMPQSLDVMDVKQLGLGAVGMDISITAKRSATHGGNGRADIYGIDAYDAGNSQGSALGNIRVQGDVTYIDAGDDAKPLTPAAKSIDVDSLGARHPGVNSELHGSVGSIKVRGNLLGSILMEEPSSKLGSLTVGGSVGNGLAGNLGGRFHLTGDLGKLSVAHDLSGSGNNSGEISVTGKVGSAFISGSIFGGAGTESGKLSATEGFGSVLVKGSVVGGTVTTSGMIQTGANTGSVKIGGSVIGGSVAVTGDVFGNDIKTLSIGGDVVGGGGQESGRIAAHSIGTLAIGGGIHGGAAPDSGSAVAFKLGTVTVGHDLTGKAFSGSGSIRAGNDIGSVTIKGSMVGANDGLLSGSIQAIGSIGKVFVGGDFQQANIIAGVIAGGDLQFGTGVSGNADFDADPAVLSKIASIVIQGSASAIAGHYGIEANKIGTLKIGGVDYPHATSLSNYFFGFDLDADKRITAREI